MRPASAAVGVLAATLGGCGTDRASAYRAGLASGDCSGIADVALADECRVQLGQCDPIVGERARAECAFRDAEARGDPARCADAGPWVDDCRMHLWTAALPALLRDRRPGEFEADAAAEAVRHGFAADDPRPWSALYREWYGRHRPMDRGACAGAADPAHAEACRQTGLAQYADLLQMAHDRGTYPCVGGPLPALLAHAPDPELDALRAAKIPPCSP